MVDAMVGWHNWLDGHEFEPDSQVAVIDMEAWCPAVYGVTKSQAWLSDLIELNWMVHTKQLWLDQHLTNFTFTFHFHALEKEMATHSSILAWRIPGTEEPGRTESDTTEVT